MNRRDALKGLAALFASPIVLPKLKREFVLDHIPSLHRHIGPVIFENAENTHEIWRDVHDWRYKRLHHNYFAPLRQSHNYYDEQGTTRNKDNQRLVERGNSERVDPAGIGTLSKVSERCDQRSDRSKSVLLGWVSSATRHQQQQVRQSNNGSGWGAKRDFEGGGSKPILERPGVRYYEDKRRELYFRPATRHDILTAPRTRTVESSDKWRTPDYTMPYVWSKPFEHLNGYQGFTS